MLSSLLWYKNRYLFSTLYILRYETSTFKVNSEDTCHSRVIGVGLIGVTTWFKIKVCRSSDASVAVAMRTSDVCTQANAQHSVLWSIIISFADVKAGIYGLITHLSFVLYFLNKWTNIIWKKCYYDWLWSSLRLLTFHEGSFSYTWKSQLIGE